jgi:ammonium transporter, Amt family
MVMLPGLALFYGGLVSSRNVLVMLQQNIFPLGLISVLWVLAGYSLAFGPDAGGGVIGNLSEFGLRDLGQPNMHIVVPGVGIPALAFVVYMMMFAVITPALITGATANRLKFAGYAVLIGLWSLIVYAPAAHWLWSAGWLARQKWRAGLGGRTGGVQRTTTTGRIRFETACRGDSRRIKRAARRTGDPAVPRCKRVSASHRRAPHGNPLRTT